MSSRYALEFDAGTVLDYVRGKVSGVTPGGEFACIGLRREGELIAGVVYEGFNRYNVWAHIAAEPGGHWLNRTFLRAIFVYPFDVAKVQRLSGYVDASNLAARRFDEHLGFREETRLKGAGSDGGDVIIYVMRREDCRYVR